ncbi:hypothetical protein C0J52_21046 [Blattella germanica]|nr:hypothetical protein C0J52_21046 [Blattella germanica]
MSDFVQRAEMKLLEAVLEVSCDAVILSLNAGLQRFADYLKKQSNVQHFYQEGDPNLADPLIYEQKQVRSSDRNYYVRPNLAGRKISAIRVLPARRGLRTPEIDMISGGINEEKVILKLVPNTPGEWGFIIKIYGTYPPENMQSLT